LRERGGGGVAERAGGGGPKRERWAGAGSWAAQAERGGLGRERGRAEREEGFFSKPFSNLNTFKTLFKTSKQTLKLFKTLHHHIKPCKQDMIHKHLFF
jgi:hypothetical protein